MLRLDATRLPTPRADGDREALRILLGARHDLTTAGTTQTNRPRALLLGGDDADRASARAPLTEHALTALIRHRPARESTREQTVRRTEDRRLAIALREARRQLKENLTQLQILADDLAPGPTGRHGIGPVCATQAIVSFSHPGR